MTDASGGLAELIDQPLQPLPPEWRSETQAALLAEARAAEAAGIDDYWAWAARRFRWMTPWTELRGGGLADLRFFDGGTLNVSDNCVDRHAEDPARADRPAVIWEGEDGAVRRLTYRDLRDAVARCANALTSLGVRRGDVVAIYLPNLPEAFIAIHACNRIGAIYTVLFSGFSSDAVALRLITSRAVCIVTADVSYRRGRSVKLLENVRQGRGRAPALRHVVVVDRSGTNAALDAGELGWTALMATQSAACPCLPIGANDPAFLIFTSGTESRPKGVVHSAAGFLIGTWANAQWQAGLTAEDVYWCAADVGWLTFPIQAVIGGLAHGATILCYEGALDTPSPERFYEIAARHNVTKILIAPTALRMLRALGDDVAERHRLASLRLVTVQGEPLDAETFHWVGRHLGPAGVPVINAYGQTETGSTWTYPVYGVDDLKAGSAGRPVPGHACRVLDEQGNDAAPGMRGDLVLTHPFPTLARTIWDDHARYLATYFDAAASYYRTSDEAVMDHDGHIWVLGRADDVINVAAHRISTMEIESAATAEPGVAEAAVVGVHHPIKGTVPIAFITLRAGADASLVRPALMASVERAIGGIARLDRVTVLSAMPKTRAGKIMRRLLREAAETGRVAGDISGLEDPAVIDTLLAAVNAAEPAAAMP
jgi:acetyl-CoA synthetase